MCLSRSEVERIARDVVNNYKAYDDIGEWLVDNVLDIEYILNT